MVGYMGEVKSVGQARSGLCGKRSGFQPNLDCWWNGDISPVIAWNEPLRV